MSIAIATMGKFIPRSISSSSISGGGGIIMKDETIKRPGILVLDMSLRDNKYKKINENFITIKSVNFK